MADNSAEQKESKELKEDEYTTTKGIGTKFNAGEQAGGGKVPFLFFLPLDP